MVRRLAARFEDKQRNKELTYKGDILKQNSENSGFQKIVRGTAIAVAGLAIGIGIGGFIVVGSKALAYAAFGMFMISMIVLAFDSYGRRK